MPDGRYIVVAVEEDGTHSAWGPMSGHRADQAVAAMQMRGIDHVFALLLHSSTDLNREVPDWRRIPA